MYIGWHDNRAPDDADNDLTGGYGQIVREFPASPVISESESPDAVVKRLQALAEPIWAAGMIPHLSLKPNIRDAVDPVTGIFTTLFDPIYKAIGKYNSSRQSSGRGDLHITLWHEPENNNISPSQFVQMHTRGYQVMSSYGVRVGPAYMAYQWDRGHTYLVKDGDARKWIVPSQLVDFYGVDAYTHNGENLPRHGGFARLLANLPLGVTTGRFAKKIYVVERGIEAVNDAAVAATINEDRKYIEKNQADFYGYAYWNTNASGFKWQLQEAGKAALTDWAESVYPDDPNPTKTYLDGLKEGKAAALLGMTNYINSQINS